MCDRSLLDFNLIVILKVTSILRRLKENMSLPFNITLLLIIDIDNYIY
jgi:hypothetical protein